jgi:dTDP-glucose 4,6-dehydratase
MQNGLPKKKSKGCSARSASWKPEGKQRMSILVTGGAGFIGRWVVGKLLSNKHGVVALDNLSNSSVGNIREFSKNPNFTFIKGDVLDQKKLGAAFKRDIGACIHLAAQINVQESIDHPERSFKNNVVGTYKVLEECRRRDARLVLVGTCMVYDTTISKPIDEKHPLKPASPYASSKLAGEELAFSYFHAYGLPTVITRPFNTYGPFQKSNLEGGVVSIFIKRNFEGKPLLVYGDGKQTRDLLYVEDCADFIVRASFNKRAVGEVINAGTGKDISISDLALMICGDKRRIKHIPHPHPQSEVRKLVCDYSKAKRILGWKPTTSLKEGIEKTTRWIASS